MLQYPSELTQALRNFLTATRDSSPAMMPSSHSGLVGTGVAAGAGGSPPNPDATSAVTLPIGPALVKIRFGLSQPVAP